MAKKKEEIISKPSYKGLTKDEIDTIEEKNFLQKVKEKVIKRATASPQPSKRISTPKFVQPSLSKNQNMMQEMFGGRNRTWGTGQNLPQINRSLISGGGLIKTGDGGRTGALFGVRR